MNEGSTAIGNGRARPQDVRADYEELKLVVDRLVAVLHHQDKEFERLLGQNSSMRPEIALVWRVGHELLEQGIAELSAVRQRMGLRIDEVLTAMAAAEARRPVVI